MGKSKGWVQTIKEVLVKPKSGAKAKAKSKKKKKDSRPSIAEQINFGGQYSKEK